MNTKKIARDVARDVLHTMNRKGYGLGECGYYIEVYAWDGLLDAVTSDEYDVLAEYAIDSGDSINWGERTRLKSDYPEMFALWREIVSKSEALAESLDDAGIVSIS